MHITFGNAQHIGARREQQDSFGFSDPADTIFAAHGGMAGVVADGIGGLASGQRASRAAVQEFLRVYSLKAASESIQTALRRALESSQAAVQQAALRTGEEIGTTLVAAAVRGSELHWISVGDSSVYLVRGGEMVQLNRPHVYGEDLDDRAAAGEITWDEAQMDPQREAVTSYLGGGSVSFVDANLKALPLRAGDCILLATDGLFKTLTDAEIMESMRGPMQERCEDLVRRTIAKHRPGQDNVTVIALHVGDGDDQSLVSQTEDLPDTVSLEPEPASAPAPIEWPDDFALESPSAAPTVRREKYSEVDETLIASGVEIRKALREAKEQQDAQRNKEAVAQPAKAAPAQKRSIAPVLIVLVVVAAVLAFAAGFYMSRPAGKAGAPRPAEGVRQPR